MWKFQAGYAVTSSPAYANGRVYVGTGPYPQDNTDHNLYALNATTGAKAWAYTTGVPVTTAPAVVNGVVYVGSEDNNLHAIGSQATAPITSAPAVSAQDAKSLDLFTKGGENALTWRHWTAGGWSSGTSLGGSLTSSPAAVSRSSSTIDVFGRGGNGYVWQRTCATTWGPWSMVAGSA